MTPEQAIRGAYRPHDRGLENRLLGPSGLTATEIVQAFYGVDGGREFLVNFLAKHAPTTPSSVRPRIPPPPPKPAPLPNPVQR